MRLFKTLILLCTIFFLFFLVSCTEEDLGRALTRADILASETDEGRSYFISSAEIDLDDVNGTLILDECVTDNTIRYFPSGRYTENEGSTTCDPNDPPGDTGSWILSPDETQLTITVFGETLVWDIISIDNNGHRVTRTDSNGQITFVFERFL